jgi:hypothetical protein
VTASTAAKPEGVTTTPDVSPPGESPPPPHGWWDALIDTEPMSEPADGAPAEPGTAAGESAAE